MCSRMGLGHQKAQAVIRILEYLTPHSHLLESGVNNQPCLHHGASIKIAELQGSENSCEGEERVAHAKSRVMKGFALRSLWTLPCVPPHLAVHLYSL